MPSGTGVLPIAAGTVDALQTRCGVSLGQTRAPAVKAAATSVRPGSDAAVHRGRIQDLVWPRQAPHPRTRSEDLVLGWGPATLPDDERASGGRSSSDSSVAISSNTGGSSSSCWECIETRESILRLARLISPRPASRPCRRSRAPGRSHLREQSKYGRCACTVHTVRTASQDVRVRITDRPDLLAVLPSSFRQGRRYATGYAGGPLILCRR